MKIPVTFDLSHLFSRDLLYFYLGRVSGAHLVLYAPFCFSVLIYRQCVLASAVCECCAECMWCSNLWHPTWGFTHLCVRRDDQQQRDMHVNKTREKRWLVSYVVLSVQQCRARSFRVKVIQSQRLVQRSLVVHAPSLVVHS